MKNILIGVGLLWFLFSVWTTLFGVLNENVNLAQRINQELRASFVRR